MMRPAEIERKAFDLMATSIREHFFVNDWEINGEKVTLPFSCESSPEDVFVMRTTVEVPEDSLTWFLKVSMEGNALLRVDGESYAGIDDVHTYIPLEPGKHDLVIEATPLTMFGYHKWKFSFDYAIMLGILWEPYSLAQRLLDLVSFIEELKEEDLKNAIMRELSPILLRVKSVPSVTQITLLRMLLYDGGLGIRELKIGRFDVREVRPDYMFLSAVYGFGILKGKVKDIAKPEKESYLQEIERVDRELEAALERLKTEFPKIGRAYAFGHAHIDAAWLWRYEETKRKVARTLSTTVRLLEKYDASFAQSSSQYYAWIEENDPVLFEKIRELVKKGRIIPVGGMWVESDVQLIDGESLVRQFLYGQRYLLEKFGRIARIGWLPDTFGFSASLPQIMLKSGIKLFSTYKILWNERNEFPYHAFIWKGIDGSEIPTHIMMSYKSSMTAKSLYKQWKMYKNRHDVPVMIYAYGYGDGGGGITWEMLEMQKHMNKLPYIPEVVKGVEDDYIKEVSELITQKWEGELYVEAHRGTYTTNARMKEYMAKAESLLRAAEIWSVLAEINGCFEYPEELGDLWKRTLLHQFHDVLPGSSIREVYEDAIDDLSGVISRAEEIIEAATLAIAEKFGLKSAVFNDLPWERVEVVEIDGKEVLIRAPPLGWAEIAGVCEAGGAAENSAGMESVERPEVSIGDGITLENEYLIATFNERGDLISLYDKVEGREMLKSRSNVLMAHIDTPGMWDAWDVNEDFLLQGEELECEKYEVFENELSCGVKFYRRYGNSTLTQTVRLKAGSKLLEFDTVVDWRDKEVLLKAWFNFNVHNWTSFYEIPYGVVERLAVRNTPWEQAKFEVPALRWADVSDGEYGVAVICSSRHGYTNWDSKLGLSLLKSPIYPNPWSDTGVFHFTYYLYPHRGDWFDGEVYRRAMEVWSPLKLCCEELEETNEREEAGESREAGEARETGKLEESGDVVAKEYSLMKTKALVTLKKAEDGDGYIIRLFNPSREELEVSLPFDCVEVDMLELEEIGKVGRGLVLKPFEIKTLKFRLS